MLIKLLAAMAIAAVSIPSSASTADAARYTGATPAPSFGDDNLDCDETWQCQWSYEAVDTPLPGYKPTMAWVEHCGWVMFCYTN